jgi:hypothetical protein
MVYCCDADTVTIVIAILSLVAETSFVLTKSFASLRVRTFPRKTVEDCSLLPVSVGHRRTVYE